MPAGGDLYVLSRLLHDWDDDAAVRILGSCRQAMSDAAGRERTLREFEHLLRQSRFELRRVVPVEERAGISLLEAGYSANR